MQPYEVYVRTAMGLEGFAHWLRELLNIPATNISPHATPQGRESANYGGAYYLFEVLGLELLLLRNAGEVEIPERPDFQLYLLVRSGDEEVDGALARHIQRILTRSGIEADVDSLSA